MNRIQSVAKPLTWFMALLLAAVVTGCGYSTAPASTAALGSAKAITAYSLAGTAGTIDETAKTIAVTKPFGTNVTALVATFTTTGASVTVGGVTQVSATTPNNFTTSKAYLVTAADSTTATYTVTVTVATAAAGPPAVDLLSITTNNFVVLAKDQITDANLGAITGNIGLSPAAGSFVFVTCGEMTGLIYTVDATYVGSGDVTCVMPGPGANKTLVDLAVADMGTAYLAASDPATPAGVGASNLNVDGGILTAGKDFAPGTYTWGSDVNVTGDITLTGGASDVWIFQMSGNLIVDSCASCASAADAAGITVTLNGGAVASNVFWQVGGGTGATLGTFSTFNGNILSATQVIVQSGAVLHGRALSQTQVTLDANTVGP